MTQQEQKKLEDLKDILGALEKVDEYIAKKKIKRVGLTRVFKHWQGEYNSLTQLILMKDGKS